MSYLTGCHRPERSFWLLGNCSVENSQLRTFSLLALLVNASFLSSAKTWPQCSFNICSSLKASCREFKRRKIAVSCLSTLLRFALEPSQTTITSAIRPTTFRAFPNLRLGFVDTMFIHDCATKSRPPYQSVSDITGSSHLIGWIHLTVSKSYYI